jgi:hypothetical protein
MTTRTEHPGHALRTATLLAALVLGLSLLAAPALAASDAVYQAATWPETAPEPSGWSANGLKAAEAIARSIGTSAYLDIDKGRRQFGNLLAKIMQAAPASP